MIATAAAFALSLLAFVAAVRAGHRAAAAPRTRVDDPVADLVAAASLLLALADRFVPALAAAARPLVARHPFVRSYLDLAGHPWRFCATLGTAAFLVVAAGGAVQGGDPSPFVGLLEAAAIALGFATLGTPLGLRSDRPR